MKPSKKAKKLSQLKVVWEYKASTDNQQRILAALDMILGDITNIEIVDSASFTKPYRGLRMTHDDSEIRRKRNRTKEKVAKIISNNISTAFLR